MIISPAMMKIFEECQQKYVYIYVDKINMPQNKYFYEKGKNIHAMANYFLKGYNIEKLEQSLNEEEKNIWNYLKKSKYFSYKTVNSEYQISSKIDDDRIGGRLDALVNDNGDYYILDYKTGTIPKDPEYDFQTIVYLLCADKLLKKYNSLNFVYLDLKNKTERKITFSEKLKEEYINKVKKILSEMKSVNNSHNALIKSNKCNCDYYCLCRNF